MVIIFYKGNNKLRTVGNLHDHESYNVTCVCIKIIKISNVWLHSYSMIAQFGHSYGIKSSKLVILVLEFLHSYFQLKSFIYKAALETC